MLLCLVAEQIQLGMSPMILSVGDLSIERKPFEVEAERQGLPLKAWRMKPGLNRAETHRICDWADHWGAEIMHSHGYKFNILLGLFGRFRRRVAVISTLHGYVHARRFTRMWFYEGLDRLIIGRMEGVVLVSNSMRRELFPKFKPRQKVFTIRNGLSVEETLRIARDQLPKQLTRFTSSHDPVILGVGRLSPEKGFDHLIDSFGAMKTAYPNAGLVIAGEGRLRTELEERADQLGYANDVFMPGYCSNVPALMARCSVLVISSITEGLPISLLEAMALRLPIVSTAVGEIPSVLEDGKNGILVGTDRRDLANILERTLRDPDGTALRAERAFRKVSEELSARWMAVQYEQVYEAVMSS